MTLTVIIPAHNEAENLERCIYQTLHHLPDAIIHIAEDGSTDTTQQIVATLASLFPQIIYTHNTERLGKGEAQRRAIQLHPNNTILLMDADLATDLNSLPQMLWTLKAKGGLIIGNRTHPNSHTYRSTKRRITSWTYNTLVRLLFHDGIKDHQCGFKLLTPTVAAIAETCTSKNYIWDTELITKTKNAGIPITEVPVTWHEQKKQSTVNLWRDGTRMLKELLHLRWESRR